MQKCRIFKGDFGDYAWNLAIVIVARFCGILREIAPISSLRNILKKCCGNLFLKLQDSTESLESFNFFVDSAVDFAGLLRQDSAKKTTLL